MESTAIVTADRPRSDLPVLIQARPHILRDDVVTCEVGYGLSLEQMFGMLSRNLEVLVGGFPVPREHWRFVRPKPGTEIVINALPAGGGGGDGNKVGRTLLMVVVAAVAIYTGNDIGLDTFAGAFAAAGIAALGSLAVNALLPPMMPENPSIAAQDPFNRKQALTGTRNRYNPYGVVPRVLGRHRYFPPFAAAPFTDVIGEAQYLRVLLMLGYGPLDISEIKIGDTPITDYEDVEYEIGESPGLYTGTVDQENFQITYDGPGDVGTSNSRTTPVDIDEIGVDFTFPQGLFAIAGSFGSPGESGYLAGGGTTAGQVELEIEYRAAGTSDPWLNVNDAAGIQTSGKWVAAGAGQTSVFITGRKRETRRAGIRWKVPRGQYEVRVKKVGETYTNPADDNSRIGTMVWTALKAFKHELPVQHLPGVQLMAVRIKQDDQLQGVVDRINMIAEAYHQVWNGADWVSQKTSNPAWIYMDPCVGPAASSPMDKDAKFYKDELKSWADWCTNNGVEFNAVIDAATNKFELMKTIAATGRAAFSNRSGKYTVVRDTLQSTPTQLFTPRNAWGFSGNRNFQRMPHALRVRWTNPDAGWQQDESIVYADGYDENTATIFEILQLRGCTNYEQAWKQGRYHLLDMKYRRETYGLNVDIENLACRRGDMVHVAHHVVRAGLQSARVKSLVTDVNGDATQLALDAPVIMESGKNYGVRIRRDDGTQATEAVTFSEGETKIIDLSAPVADVNEGDLVAFGIVGEETLALKVIDIKRGDRESALLKLAAAAPEVTNVDNEVPPAYSGDLALIIDPAMIKCCLPEVDVTGETGSTDGGATTEPAPRTDTNVMPRSTGGIRAPAIGLRVRHGDPLA